MKQLSLYPIIILIIAVCIYLFANQLKQTLIYVLEQFEIINEPTMNKKPHIDKNYFGIENLPLEIENKLIIQLADFHFQIDNPQFITRIVKLVNSYNPDLILMTGDFINAPYWDTLEPLSYLLADLKAKDGIYAVFGNHDIKYPDKEKFKTILKTNANITVLENEVVEPFGKGFQVIGIGEHSRSHSFKPEEAFIQIEEEDNASRLIVVHDPTSVKTLSKFKWDVLIAGHAHGGSIRVPFYGSFYKFIHDLRKIVPSFLQQFLPYHGRKLDDKQIKYSERLHQLHIKGEKQPRNILVSRGLGSSVKPTKKDFRIFCNPEINLIYLNQQKE